jgi:ABC-type antimicrobial peptide transport system permease subunit
MALGAARAQVLWMVLREALWLALAGVAIGIPAALAIGRLASARMPRLLFELKAGDPWTIAAAAFLLAAAAGMAAYLPARRASRLDPMAVLRNQ